MHRFSEFNINTLKKQEMLNKFLTVAPLHHNYALCIQYIRQWFLEKFNKDFFAYVHLDGSHVFGEMTRLSKDQIVSHANDDKGEVIILPQIDEAYDREHIDMNYFGIDQFIDTTLKTDKAFMQDPVNKKYLLMKMDMILMNFIDKIIGHKYKHTSEIKPLQPRLYVLVNNRLNPIYAAVQGGHSVLKWTFEHHDISEAVVREGYLIYLSGDTYLWKKKLE